VRIAVRVAGSNFKLPADNTIGSMLFPWLARRSCSVIQSVRK